jgi:hypothetical protein
MGLFPNDSRGLQNMCMFPVALVHERLYVLFVTNANNETPTTLETETCGRCGGSGQYSYNQLHGSVCYGCRGKGTRYTKRGLVAANYLETLRSKRAADVVVGDQFKVDAVCIAGGMGSSGGWCRVTSITPSTTGKGICLSGILRGRPYAYHVGLDTVLRMAQTAEQKAATLAQAVAFQATLTKSGKPRK